MSNASLAMMDNGRSSTAPPDTASVNVHSHSLYTPHDNNQNYFYGNYSYMGVIIYTVIFKFNLH